MGEAKRRSYTGAFKAHQAVTVTLRNDRKDGSLFYNRFSIRPLYDREGRIIYYLGVQYDVTEQVRAEEELARLNAHLRAAGETP
jgi:PAS domain S-box-containing protein